MKHRVFLALDVPPGILAEISDLRESLSRLNLPIQWEPAENIHLTLNFLGRLPDDKIGSLFTVITKVAKKFSPFTLQPVFLEYFYHRHERSVIYLAAVDTPPVLKELYTDLSRSFNHLDLPQPTRFTSHITIGKLQKTDPQSAKEYLGHLADFDFSPLSPFVVDHLTLYESFVTRTGATYQKIKGFALAAAGESA